MAIPIQEVTHLLSVNIFNRYSAFSPSEAAFLNLRNAVGFIRNERNGLLYRHLVILSSYTVFVSQKALIYF